MSRKLYGVQFEDYIPTRPDLRGIPRWTAWISTWIPGRVRTERKTELGSDREYIDALIRAKGYKIPANMMYVRLVYLLDAEKRKELMSIYGEDSASTGFTAADLREAGKAHGQWPTLQKGLIEAKIALEETRCHDFADS